MRSWPGRLSLAIALLLTVVGCGSDEPARPAGIGFTRVELPGGAAPVVLSAGPDSLLVGLRRTGQPVVPGLVRLGPDGRATEITVHGVSPYALRARWRSIAFDGERIVGLGGERGGAHGHVRWSVWAGTTSEIHEQVQGFSTFGGYAAGDLVDAVLTPAGGALVGAWESGKLGFDVAVWTPKGDDWVRQSSAGTALESAENALGFPMAAAAADRGILVAGWQVTLGAGNGNQQPAVWRSTAGNTGWTRTALPDGGRTGTALAVRCWDGGCGVAGRADGNLAVWQFAGGAWTRRPGLPRVAVGDRERLAAPVEVGGHLVQPLTEDGQVRIATADGDGWTVRPADGPTGSVTAATIVGGKLYLLAGPDEDSQTLWQADVTDLTGS